MGAVKVKARMGYRGVLGNYKQSNNLEPVGKERKTVGRTYLSELEKLAQTLEWANKISIEELSNTIKKIGVFPLFI